MDDGSHSHAQQLQSLTGASENNSQFGGTSDSSAKQDTILLEPSFQFAANQWPPLLQRRDINNQQQQHPQITREGGAESEAANDQMLRPTEPPMFTSTFRPQNSMFQSGQKYSPYRVPRNRRSFLGSYSTSEEKTLSESSFATPASTRRAKRPSPIDTHAPLIWKSSNDSQALKKVEEKDDQSGNADAGSDTQERGRIAGGIRREMERSRLGRLLGQPTSPSTNKSADKPPLPPGFESRSDTSMRESLVGGGPISTTGPVSQGSMLAPSAFGPPSHLTSDGPSAPTTPMSISSDGPGTTGFPFQMVGIGGTTPSSRLSSRRNSDDNGMMMDMTLLSSSFPNQMTESLVNDTRMSRDSSPALSESFGRGIPISRRIPSWSGGGGSSRPAVNPFIRPPPQSSSLSDIFSADTASPSMDTSEGSSTTPKMGSGSESGRNARWNSPMMEDSPTPKRSRQRSLPSLSVNPMSGTRSGRPYPPMTPVRARYAGDDEGRTSRSVLRTPAALRSVSSSDRPQTPMTLRHSQQSGIKNRIIRLLQEETHLTEKEFAHEHAAMEYIKLLHDGDANAMRDSENLPESPHSMVSFADELFGVAELNLPLRVSPIPNAAIKSPATYLSHSSKLNPENNFIVSKHSDYNSSPSLSPVIPAMGSSSSLLTLGNSVMGSPWYIDRKNKRKLSLDSERLDLAKRPARFHPGSSPTASPFASLAQTGGGSMFGSSAVAGNASPTPPGFHQGSGNLAMTAINNAAMMASQTVAGSNAGSSGMLFFPPSATGGVHHHHHTYPYSRTRSPSMSSVSSVSSMAGVVQNGGGGTSSGQQQGAERGNAQALNVPMSPRTLSMMMSGKLLNIQGAQGEFSKMSLGGE